MDDDLNTPRAIAALFDLCRDINRGRDEGKNLVEAQQILRRLGEVLGLTFAAPETSDNVAAHPFIDMLVEVRTRLREAKQFALADSIRDRLTELGSCAGRLGGRHPVADASAGLLIRRASSI